MERSAGILAHPISFPSSYGIGELGSESYVFIDFLVKSKMKLWQTLPLGPTSFGDSPYQSFSTFAGNPNLISIEILIKEGILDNPVDIPVFNETSVDYGQVIIFKNALFRIAFKKFKETSVRSKQRQFTIFCNENKLWLDDFALFMAIKEYFIEERRNITESEELESYKELNKDILSNDQINDYFYGAVWTSWPNDIKKRKPDALKEYSIKLAEEIELVKFLQYLFFTQWTNLKVYANDKGISIIGDIPIFVAMDSADTWSNPHMFCLDDLCNPTSVAGVPPDYFSATGQLWGNPLYNWIEAKDDVYSWWLNRVKSALKLFDMIRIDHFRGFDTYWAIPYGEKTAINGKWIKGPGKKLFQYLKQEMGTIPIIAEDLGIITDSVVRLRESVNLPGMKVLQFAFESSPDDSFLPHNYKNSNFVVYTGTHDNDTTIGWYNGLNEKAKDYFRRYMNVPGDSPNWDLIRLAFSSSADYCIIPVQDILSLGSEARMNVPGVPSGNWMFRFTDEALSDNLSETLVYLTELFNRYPENEI